jgi:DNA-binding IscR family transcriptional regulator
LESAGKSDIEETPQLRLTHEEIAQLIGTSRETVTRVLGSLKRENLIELKQGIVRLIDPAELERLVRAGECLVGRKDCNASDQTRKKDNSYSFRSRIVGESCCVANPSRRALDHLETVRAVAMELLNEAYSQSR